MSLSNIRIVLVEPNHPGNIGAAARAMKTMGLSQLCLVRPNRYPSEEADARAVTAVDVLRNAVVSDDLHSVIRDCKLVIGGSGRTREFPLPALDAREGGLQMTQAVAAGAQVAVLFGTESDGLSNQSLDACTHQLRIPASPEFKSLNLAAAVQIVCYEIFIAAGGEALEPPDQPSDSSSYPSQEELEFYHRHLEATLESRDYYGAINPERVNLKLRRLLARARPKSNELRLLHSLVRLMRR
jgi:tRNA (cytidine32/uridine32-2'-O)-methyltransferase